MSKVTDQLAAVQANQTAIGVGIQNLDTMIQKFEASSETDSLSPAGQAMLDNLVSQSAALASLASTIPAPPAGTVATPVITSITPNTAAAGSTTSVALAGTGFTNATSLKLDVGLSAANFKTQGDTGITADLTVTAGLTPSTLNVIVVASDGTTMSAPVTFATT